MKANSTLAAELKKLGFRRGVESWNKSRFEKRIWNEERGVVIITVEIENSQWVDGKWVKNNWVVNTNRMRLTTNQHDDGFKIIGNSVAINAEMAQEIADTFNAVKEIQ